MGGSLQDLSPNRVSSPSYIALRVARAVAGRAWRLPVPAVQATFPGTSHSLIFVSEVSEQPPSQTIEITVDNSRFERTTIRSEHQLPPPAIVSGGSVTQVTNDMQESRGARFIEESRRWEAAELEQNIKLAKATIQVFLRSALLPGGFLDHRADNMQKALRHSDSGSAVYTRSKIQYASHYWYSISNKKGHILT